jgi:exoribonuclease R
MCLMNISHLRRYADVVVHRLLSASLGLIQLPAQVRGRVQPL